MKDMFLKDGMPEEIAEMMIGEIPPEQTLWVISNSKGINGAVNMLYENELHDLAENLGSDLYILPSSVHEVLAVSSEMGSPEELAEMVVQVNMEAVDLDERLSNHTTLPSFSVSPPALHMQEPLLNSTNVLKFPFAHTNVTSRNTFQCPQT